MLNIHIRSQMESWEAKGNFRGSGLHTLKPNRDKDSGQKEKYLKVWNAYAAYDTAVKVYSDLQ